MYRSVNALLELVNNAGTGEDLGEAAEGEHECSRSDALDAIVTVLNSIRGLSLQRCSLSCQMTTMGVRSVKLPLERFKLIIYETAPIGSTSVFKAFTDI